ncbi:hypothetical protein [Rhizobium leguminosarum]|uniref:hypothetical protein n=1 Tax=Rhizobium leguminosarum TaxID=384 RepID=UPI0012BC1A69|nr:hypothetical protein [Rhizobium leguminosarum]
MSVSKARVLDTAASAAEIVLNVSDFKLDEFGRYELENVEWLEEIAGGEANAACGNTGCGNGGCACIQG